jgi:hypothetical protein
VCAFSFCLPATVPKYSLSLHIPTDPLLLVPADNTANDGRRLTLLCYLNPNWYAIATYCPLSFVCWKRSFTVLNTKVASSSLFNVGSGCHCLRSSRFFKNEFNKRIVPGCVATFGCPSWLPTAAATFHCLPFPRATLARATAPLSNRSLFVGYLSKL